jgi:sodium-dependent dicarboxylate transporter 2/3/5
MLIFLAIDDLTLKMRLTLAVFVASITAWTILDLPDTPVALAAMLAPVYLGLATAIGNTRVNRALALLFPSVILLSAGASLIGAGAHLVAAGMMERLQEKGPDFLGWIALAGPFSLLCSLLACAVLLRLFLTREERAIAIAERNADEALTPLTRQQWTVLAVTGAMILLFAAQPMHGIGMPLIGIAAALLLANHKVSGLPLKAALKSVEWNLLLFLAGTLVIGEALLETGTAKVLAERMVDLAGNSIAASPALLVFFAAVVATLSHLVITSRTARATILIPALALPVAALGVDPLNLVMVVTLASGFCQTLMVSAKPVALFGAMDPPPFGQADLFRLAGWLIVPFVVLLVVFATLVWPLQDLPLY